MKDPKRFENAERLKELAIVDSLKKFGLSDTDIICDYGAGTGIFVTEAAMITRGTVYALDMSAEMISIIDEKVINRSINNVKTIQVEMDQIPLEDNSIDLFAMITVFHHIEKISTFISEIKRVIKDKGKIMIIDFHKKDSPLGPPTGHRMSEVEVVHYFAKEGIKCIHKESLGENFYLLGFM